MYRSIRAMWLSAALAALSGGQALVAQTASPAASGSKERFVTLELDGGKPMLRARAACRFRQPPVATG